MADEPPKPIGRPFAKGQTGNPGGRTKAHRELARYIREKTMDGRSLADYCIGLVENPKTEPRVGMLAVEWLGDRGIGKSVLPIDLVVTDAPPPEAEIDWDAVPLEKRVRLLNAIKEIEELERKEPTDGDGDDA
jgi:hypothetical protein